MKEIINQHKVMKKLLIFQLGLLAILLSACQQKSATTQQTTPDSIYSVAHISRVYEKDRPKAFELIRIAEEKKQLEAWQADSLRAKICLDDFYDLNKSIEYALRTLTYDEVVSNPQRHLNMLTLISQIEVSLGRFSECIRFSDEGMKLAEELNDDNSACQLMINAGYSMYFMKEKKKGLEYMLRAESILEKKTDERNLRTLSFCYGQLMLALWVDDTDAAILRGKKREALLDKMETEMPDIPKAFFDTRRGLTFSKMADFYALKNDKEQARLYADKFKQTELSKTARGHQLILDYYCTIHDFPMICETYQKSLPYWEHKDSFCNRYASVLGMLTKAYAKEGMLRQAFDLRTRQFNIKDSMLVREALNEGLRFAAIYQTHDKEIALAKERADAQRYLILGITALILLTLVCAFAFYRHQQHKKTREKNRMLLRQLDTINEYQKKIQQTTVTTTEEDVEDEVEDEVEDLTETDDMEEKQEIAQNEEAPVSAVNKRRMMQIRKFHQLIEEEQAFLQPDFSRDKLQTLMGISKNSLSPILNEVLGDAPNLSEYINSKRVTFACQLLREHPQMTIDAIAADSGFSTTRNFRRCFKAQTGMSPAEYREASMSIE